MHIVGDIRRDEVITRNVVSLEVGGQFRIGADMFGEPPRIVRNVVEVNERIVVSDIGPVVHPRVVAGVVTLLIRPPGNAGIFQQRDQVLRRADVVGGRQIVVVDAEVRAGFEPEIIGFAFDEAGRREILLRVRGHRQQSVVDVRAITVAVNRGPIFVLHHNDEHGLDVGELTAPRFKDRRQKKAAAKGLGPAALRAHGAVHAARSPAHRGDPNAGAGGLPRRREDGAQPRRDRRDI